MATKRNAIGVLMGVELVLNGANVNFVAFARFNPGLRGRGAGLRPVRHRPGRRRGRRALAIVLNFYNNHATVDVDTAEELKG